MYISHLVSPGRSSTLPGVSSSKLIVAVNKDPAAPIFKSADYGIVGDIQDVMPKLIEAIQDHIKSERINIS
jgi:electron transfer flavoprotein alpha subunit